MSFYENDNTEEQNDMVFFDEGDSIDDQEFSFNFAKEFGNFESKESCKEEEEDDFEFYRMEQSVSGTHIESENTPEEIDIVELMKNLNEVNYITNEEDSKRLADEEMETELEELRAREEARAKRLKEEHEEEKRERERLRLEEEEEERRLEEEALAKRKANPLLRLKDAVADVTSSVAEKRKTNKESAEDAEEFATEAEQEAEENKEPNTEPEVKKEKKEKASKKKEEKASKKEVDYKYLATHDKLTGMKNLTAYDQDSSNCKTKDIAILFFDINDLKFVNDTLGHAMGNKLITTAATLLEGYFPEQVYRIGGDEFVVLARFKKSDDVKEIIETKIAHFKAAMLKATQEDESGLNYSASVGYAIGDGEKTIAELQDEADQMMYKNKQEYKKTKAEKDAKKKAENKDEPEVDHDSLLPQDQRMLKEVIRENHETASEASTEQILREVQRKYSEIIAILIASPTFDHLFIIQDVDEFINLVMEMDNLIDYSYLYVVYENGTQFYGIDEYYDAVTELFTEIGNVIKSRPSISDKDLLKIKKINMFKNIYID